MNKPAPVTYEVHPLISSRWSPRAYNSKDIPKDALRRIFEAARWAPSSSNDQEWRYIIGFKGDQTWQHIFDTLVEFNQLWAKDAPVLILACGMTISAKTGKNSPVYSYDVGQSVAMLSLQAAHEGLYVHQMGGYDKQKARELFNLPNEVEPLTAISIGYYGDAGNLHPNLQPMEMAERVRNNFNTFVFANKYGQPSGLFDE
jgi:nitroreductase